LTAILSDLPSLFRLRRAPDGGCVSEFSRVEAKGSIVDNSELEEEEEEEKWARDTVEDAVPDHLGGGRDDVGTLGYGPTNGIGDEHERKEGRRKAVATEEGAVGGECRTGSMPEQHVPKSKFQSTLATKQVKGTTYQM
jgi:hypothetical protein